MLTREGEYSSADDIARDANANTKRGIPYYERALDNLAKEFAKVFNEMNQISLDVVYDMGGNPPTGPVDKDGNAILDAGGVPITWGQITETVKTPATGRIQNCIVEIGRASCRERVF